MKNLIVSKFGGTSMKDAARMQASAAITVKNEKVAVVVVSATSGTTDDLIALYQAARKADSSLVQEKWQKINDRHLQIAKDLNLEASSIDIESLLKELLHTINAHVFESAELKWRDEVFSFGERLSSVLFVKACEQQSKGTRTLSLFDVRKVMKTNDFFSDASPLIDEMEKLGHVLRDEIKSSSLIVTQGFIGSNLKGETTTLGRGGSDYSAALLAALLHASELHIWTDVSGVSTIDPKILPQEARPIPELTYFEAAELANLGAKVLHPLTLSPCVEKEIPVFVGNSFEPESAGTWIAPDHVSKSYGKSQVKAFARRKNQSIITFSRIKKLQTHGFLATIFGLLAKHQISIDHVTTSEISTSIAIQDRTRLTPSLLS
jgi:aspartate kinase